MSGVVGVYLELSIACPRCGRSVPVNRAVREVACSHCAGVIELPVASWQRLLGEQLVEAANLADGELRTSRTFGVFSDQFDYGRMAPRCGACRAPLPEVDLDQPAAVACRACGQSAPVRTAPPWMRELHPAVAALVGEAEGTDEATPMPGAQPMVLHCMVCGGELPCDGRARTVACGFCGTDNMIPDPVWQRLHPAVVRSPWFILLDLRRAAGLLPSCAGVFCGLAASGHGGPLVAYQDDDERCFVDGLDRAGTVVWRTGDLDFSSDAYLLTSPGGGYVALVDRERGRLHYLDPRDGRVLAGLDGGAVGVDLTRLNSVALDGDGTVLVLIDSDRGTELIRLAGDGTRRPVGDGRAGSIAVDVGLSKLATGNDGTCYLLHHDLTRMVGFDRAGRLVVDRALAPPADLRFIHAFGADARSTLYLLCSTVGGGVRLLRLAPGQPLQTLAGTDLPGSAPIDPDDEHLTVAPDGTLLVGCDLDSLRVFDPDGRLLWRSLSTVGRDADRDDDDDDDGYGPDGEEEDEDDEDDDEDDGEDDDRDHE